MDIQIQIDRWTSVTPSATEEYPDFIGELLNISRRKALARKQLNLLKLEYEIWWARVYSESEKALGELLGRTPTISAIEYYTRMQYEDEYRRLQTQTFELEFELDDLGGIHQALLLRKDYLMNQAADTRAGV